MGILEDRGTGCNPRDSFGLLSTFPVGGRFRHGTKFLRWRPDKAPAHCTFEQIE